MNARDLAGKWTAEAVRECLPPVAAVHNGKHIIVYPKGRLLPFAQIGSPVACEVAWGTLADILNRGAELHLS